MNVSFSHEIGQERSGKHKFITRLSKEFRKRDISIVSGNASSDVHIIIPGGQRNKKSKVNLLRLDGLIIDKMVDYKSSNQKILQQIKESDALIFQGEFCKEAYTRFLGIGNKPTFVIPNGASKDEFLARDPHNFFLANCKWRPHKRLDTIVEAFVELSNEQPDYCLYVTGEVEEKLKVNHGKIKYLGWTDSSSLRVFLSQAICTIHLSWIDWCPNAMVESVVAGCPVIYTDSGGHKELAEGCGIPIPDKEWNWQPVDYYHPPKIDISKITQAFTEALNLKNENIYSEKLQIEATADKYINMFKQVL